MKLRRLLTFCLLFLTLSFEYAHAVGVEWYRQKSVHCHCSMEVGVISLRCRDDESDRAVVHSISCNAEFGMTKSCDATNKARGDMPAFNQFFVRSERASYNATIWVGSAGKRVAFKCYGRAMEFNDNGEEVYDNRFATSFTKTKVLRPSVRPINGVR